MSTITIVPAHLNECERVMKLSLFSALRRHGSFGANRPAMYYVSPTIDRPRPASEVDLGANLHQPALQNQRRCPPRWAVRIVLREDPAAVERVERALDARASRLEALTDPDVHLCEAISVDGVRRDQLRHLRAARRRASERRLRQSVRRVDRVVGQDLWTRAVLHRRAGPQVP